MEILRSQEILIDQFDEALWNALIENVTMETGSVEFIF
jgi:hypothetical protein